MNCNAWARCCCLTVMLAFGFVFAVPGRAESSIERDVVYGHKFGLAMTMDVYRPAEEANGAGVLFMVSGGWYSTWDEPEKRLPLFQPLLDRGYTVFSVLHGSSPKFTIPEAVSDVRRSVRFIRTHAERFGIDADRLGVFGMSAGGHLSLMLGTTSDAGNPHAEDTIEQASDRVAAVVAYVAPTDLTIMVWEAEGHLRDYERFPALNLSVRDAEKVSPLLHVSEDDAPTLLIAGDKDELVPISHSENLHKSLQEKQVPTDLFVVEGAGHGFNHEQAQRALDVMLAWFDQHLKKAQ